MKNIKNSIKMMFVLLFLVACSESDLRDTSFINNILPPSNVSAIYNITQDNSGSVTITPSAEGAVSYEITFGDGTAEPATISEGQSVTHVYTEGTYEVKVIASNVTGKTTEVSQQLIVSFKAPQNLVVVIENDAAVSKKVNITANADFATTFEFNSGETGVAQPVVSGNIGEKISYIYENAGTFNVVVEAKGGAIETTKYEASFEVTEILAPINVAPVQPSRKDTDLISIYSDVSGYTNVSGTDTFPDWGQGSQGSSWAEFDLNGDKMLQYVNISYQGIQFGSAQDLSNMEFIHLDVWTTDVAKLETSLISLTNGEKPVTSDLTPNEWTTINIPISEFTDQGLTVADIHQLKFVGDPWAAGTVFIDNIYFYKLPTGIVTSKVEDFEGAAPTFTVFGNIAPTEIVPNPSATGKNTSANVAKLTKTAGSEVWAGTFFEVSTPLDFTNFSKISMKTWSPKNGATVKMKLENSDASITHEVDMTTTVTGAWEELTYDFSAAPAADYIRIVVFFDFGNAGDDSVYYYDEINLVNDSGADPGLVFQDFEGTAPTFTVFGNIAATEVVSNPNANGLNTTANVAKLTKTSGSEVWAGTFFEVSSPLDFTNYSKISAKVLSPKSGIVVKMKLENSDASITHEVDLNTTTSGSWEELVYDFSGAPTADYTRIVIFFDFGNAGDDSVYYYDELTLKN